MTTKTCPYCAEDIQDAAIKCRYCGSFLSSAPPAREWYRELDSKMIAGVSSGLARQFGVSATALRIGFVIAAFIGGWGLLIYVALWIIMPVAKPSSGLMLPPPLPTEPSTPPVEPEAAPDEVEPEAAPDEDDEQTSKPSEPTERAES